MDILFLMIPVSVVLVFLIGVVFWRSIRQGQFEDLEGPAYRMLMDDDTFQDSSESPKADGQSVDAVRGK